MITRWSALVASYKHTGLLEWTTGTLEWTTGILEWTTEIATYLIRCSLRGGGGGGGGGRAPLIVAQLLLVHTKHLAIATHEGRT